MADHRKEVSPDETEQVIGGIIQRYDCQHENMSLTGEKKEENGVVYFQFRCDSCRKLFWVKETELFAPATVVG